LYERVKRELKEIQQANHLSRAVPIVPSLSQVFRIGDEPAQLRILADAARGLSPKIPRRKGEGYISLEARKKGSPRETTSHAVLCNSL
jgi:hypothetical protein